MSTEATCLLILVALAAGIAVGHHVRMGKAPMRARPKTGAAEGVSSSDTYQHRVVGALASASACGCS